MKGRIRRSAQPVFRNRDPGPRELQRRYLENLYTKAEASSKPKPRPPETPDNSGRRR
jgi:hypothetical protein